MRAARWLFAYGVVLVAAVTWPFLVPGEAFLHRDMVVFDGMALTRAALGFGDLPARNVPQDALLAVVPHPVFAVRLVMVLAAACAAWAGWRLGRTNAGKAAAMTVAVFNPFVVERMLQGQWSLAAAAWLLPAAALGWREGAPWAVVAHWAASLTPSGALAAAVFARGRLGAVTSAVTCAPWAVAGMLAAGGGQASAASAAAFAPRAEGHVGTLGALLGLGGVWNAAAVPASREVGFALFGVVLFGLLALGWPAVPRGWLLAAGAGFGVAAASWAGLTAPLVERVPGGGLLRDAQKWLILAVPAFVAAAGALEARVAKAAAACALLQVPDAPVALAALTPSQLEVVEVDHGGRDVLFEGASSLVLIDGTPTVNPTFKAMNVVEPGALVVDGVVVDAPNARWVAAQGADVGTLRALGVGLVVHADGSVTDTGAPAKPLPPAGVALFALWLTVPLLALCPKSQKSSARR